VVVRSDVRGVATPSSWTTGWKNRHRLENLRPERDGVWLVETYRTQFAAEINAKGIDGLIATLSKRNKANAKAG
jgi:phospholipid transport system substrate-binding protein